jgi:hypothetical protein
MKDLYKRLHVLPNAGETEIRAALPTADPESRADAEYILLNPARRKVYDRNHRVLTRIGQMRSRLALGLRPFWSHGHHQDFNVAVTPTRVPENLNPLNVMERSESKRHGTRSLWGIIAAALVAGFAACWWWMTHHSK